MSDYISREDAMDAWYTNERYTDIEGIPSADVVEKSLYNTAMGNVYGKWLEHDCGQYVECKCSVCGYKDFIPTKFDRYWFNRNFCPNCGARMVNDDV